MDDLKKYEVDIKRLPRWYYETIEEFIVYYCEDMHWRNKVLLLELIGKTKPQLEPDDSKIVSFARKSA